MWSIRLTYPRHGAALGLKLSHFNTKKASHGYLSTFNIDGCTLVAHVDNLWVETRIAALLLECCAQGGQRFLNVVADLELEPEQFNYSKLRKIKFAGFF